MALRKFSTTFLMSTSATDARQTPAYSATVEVYRQGGKVVSDTTVLFTAPTTINLRGVGAIEVGDTLQAGTDTTRQMTVNAVTSETAITATAVGIANVALLTNERLVVVGATVPTLYNNAFETGSALANPLTSDSQGYVEFYTADSPFDLIVRRTGMSPEVYEDMESGEISTVVEVGLSFDNVLNYADTATALSEVASGTQLYFPSASGPYTPPSAAGWTITKPMTIFSDGPSVPENKCFMYFNSSGAANKNSTVFTISPTAVRDVEFRDIVISNAAGIPATGGTGDAIRFIGAGSLTSVRITNCWLLYAGRSGFFSGNDAATANLVGLNLKGTRAQSCGGHGIFVYAGHLISMDSTSSAVVNGGQGAMFLSCGNGIDISGSDFELNGLRLAGTGAGTMAASTMPQDYGVGYNAQLHFSSCNGVSVRGCNIEHTASQNPTHAKIGITLNSCKGGVVGGNTITNGSSVAATVGIKLIGGTQCATILSNSVSYHAASVQIDDPATDTGNVIFPQHVIGDATGPGTILIPAGANRNFIFANNIVSSVSDNKGVGLIYPMVASAHVTGGVLQEGLVFYASGAEQVRVRKSATTTAVP
jgi:hypothetical protein